MKMLIYKSITNEIIFLKKNARNFFLLLWFLANQISFMRFWRIYHNLKWTHTTRSYSNVTEFINNEWMTIFVVNSLHVPYWPHNLKSRCADFTPVCLSCWEQLWLILYIVYNIFDIVDPEVKLSKRHLPHYDWQVICYNKPNRRNLSQYPKHSFDLLLLLEIA